MSSHPLTSSDLVARPALWRVSLTLTLASVGWLMATLGARGIDAFAADSHGPYALFAAVAFGIAQWTAGGGHSGRAAGALGVGAGVVVAGLTLRGQPLLGQLLACVLGGLVARGYWGERELRAQLDASEVAAAKQQQLLRHAMRVSTLGNYAALVAHGVRNKLQLIEGEAVLAITGEADGVTPRLHAIRARVAESSTLSDQLLTLAHPGEAPTRRVDLGGFVTEFGARVAPVLPQVVRLTVQREHDQPLWVELPVDDLDHALLNLVLNAKDAVGDQGGQITLRVLAENDCARIDVIDDGIGMDADTLQRVFESYFTTKPAGKGTGLGLPAVRATVAHAGGKISVESAPGRGSTFRILLPIATASATTEALWSRRDAKPAAS